MWFIATILRMKTLDQELLNSIDDCIAAVKQLSLPENINFIQEVSALIAQAYEKGNKVIVAGNGGSLCDAAHFTEELTGFFREKRPALPAIALTDPGHITCVANDIGFESVFSRGIEAFGQPGDIFVGLSTSGNSPNILHALKKAKEMQLTTVAFLGKDGGQALHLADYFLTITGFRYSDRIQEAHMAAIHLIIEQIETKIFTVSAV
ncbi:MAG: D-sedoheptulose 7-phosphate isomerase [Chlamydiales bacterium]